MKTLLAVAFTAVIALGAPGAFAQAASTKTVAAVHAEMTALSGKEVQVVGKVVKVNNGIMGRNFVHVQDGTGTDTTNNLIVTSKNTAAVGDRVSVVGRVVLNREFGSGYTYPLLIEDTVITPAK